MIHPIKSSITIACLLLLVLGKSNAVTVYSFELRNGKTFKDLKFESLSTEYAFFTEYQEGHGYIHRIPIELIPERAVDLIKENEHGKAIISQDYDKRKYLAVNSWNTDMLARGSVYNAVFKNNLKNDTLGYPARGLYQIKFELSDMGYTWWRFKRNNCAVNAVVETSGFGSYIIPLTANVSRNIPSVVSWVGPIFPPGEEICIKLFDTYKELNEKLNNLDIKLNIKLPNLKSSHKIDSFVFSVARQFELGGNLGIGEFKIFGDNKPFKYPDIVAYGTIGIPSSGLKTAGLDSVKEFSPYTVKTDLKNSDKKAVGKLEFQAIHNYVDID